MKRALLPLLVVALAGCPYVRDEQIDRIVDADGDGAVATAFGGDDCDDGDPGAYPGAAEVWYDGVDGDCAGGDDFDQDADGVAQADDCDDVDAAVGAGGTWYTDADEDGHGAGDGALACDPPAGSVATAGDCDDGDPAVSPDAVEVCDGATDEDCDGHIDDADDAPVGVTDWYADADEDGYGAGPAVPACAMPAGHVATADDCDDTDADVFPDANEIVGDRVDSDCACEDETDLDGDGVDDDLACPLVPEVCPVAPPCMPLREVAGDGVDQDCDGADLLVDGDGDGAAPVQAGGTDCDDMDPTVTGGAVKKLAPNASISAAIASLACDYATIELTGPGTYMLPGTVLLDRPVRLVGDGATLKTGGMGAVLRLETGGAWISDVVIADTAGPAIDLAPAEDPMTGEVLPHAGEMTTVERVTLARNVTGIVVGNGQPLVVRGSAFEETTGVGPAIDGRNLQPPGEGEPDLNRIEVEDTTFTGNTREAISFNAGEAVVRRVSVTDQLGTGTPLFDLTGAGFEIADVEITDCVDSDPFLLEYALSGELSGVRITGGSYASAAGFSIDDLVALGGGPSPAGVIVEDVRIDGVTAAGGSLLAVRSPLARLSRVEVVGGAGVSGAAIEVDTTSGSASVDHVLVLGSDGSGLEIVDEGAVSYVTAVGNAGSGVVFATGGDIEHSISAYNGEFGVSGSGVAATDVLAWGNTAGAASDAGLALTELDPLVVAYDPSLAPALWDAHLRDASPAVDEGALADDDPDGSRADAGWASGEDSLPWYYDDTDGDAIPDGFEAARGLNPLSWDDACLDEDGDGLDALGEWLAGSWPSDRDTDGDGAEDGADAVPLDTTRQ